MAAYANELTVLINSVASSILRLGNQTSRNTIRSISAPCFAGDPFVAFGDVQKGGDFNYNDMTFLFTNVSINALPNLTPVCLNRAR